MKIEIDQNGKIENTSKHTYLAFSNKKSCIIKLTGKTKRQLQEIFRRRGNPRLFVYRVFACLIFVLIKHHLKKIQIIIIDKEYPGKEYLIKDILLEQIRKHNLKEPEIKFANIGKHSKAHYLANGAANNKIKPEKIIKLEEIKKFAIKK